MSVYPWLTVIVLLCATGGCRKRPHTASTSSPTPRALQESESEYTPKQYAPECTPEQYASFKQRMLPKVGQTITATGLVQFGKMGLHMPLQDCDVWIYATKEPDFPCWNQLIDRFDRHIVTVTGPLRHEDSTAPPDLAPDAEVPIQYTPDHFYFDVAETTMSEATSKH